MLLVPPGFNLIDVVVVALLAAFAGGFGGVTLSALLLGERLEVAGKRMRIELSRRSSGARRVVYDVATGALA
jgi:hypothetical protein